MSKIKQTLLAVIEANTSGEPPDLDQAAREQHDGTLYSLVPGNERRVLRAPGIITRPRMIQKPCTSSRTTPTVTAVTPLFLKHIP